MSDALNVVPTETKIETGVEAPSKVAGALADVLADTYRLLYKTHAYHWNVEGPLFHSVHELTEQQYTDLFEAADVLAERMRALGQLAPFRFAELARLSAIEDMDATPAALEMLEDLADSHERIARRLHALAELAAESRDVVTEDLATERLTFHEKAVWMLRALAKI